MLNICRVKERDCNLVLLEEALLLRIQSARSHRHVNLLAVKWSLDCNYFFFRNREQSVECVVDTFCVVV
jgi:hypothetical protein